MKARLHALSASLFLATAAHAAPVTVTLEGSLNYIQRTVYEVQSSPTQPGYSPEPPSYTTSYQYPSSFGGLSLGDKAVFTFQVDPAVVDALYTPATLTLKAGQAGEGSVSFNAWGHATPTSLGLSEIASSMLPVGDYAAKISAQLNFASGALGTGADAADYLQALSKGQLAGVSASLYVLGNCPFASSCTNMGFTFDKVTLAAAGASVTAAVPEPSTMALMGLGLASLLLANARGRRPG
ncbi:hypothetical protein JY96_14545 [Aquabacterium sp. NJ1]|uniref:PEP-CTERM sorting domain-containing protein n=1 Tax=Aquabacterium sp. NJ1 TaxID=1538295 RepID=UPI00052C0943|nr:PEP-CTERM sorting domain-containing protein [Aquabacterium sp. NJ1]KGM40855.1 hypothetical protein JY96_14545 [Aquabacterium sp. NJ1]